MGINYNLSQGYSRDAAGGTGGDGSMYQPGRYKYKVFNIYDT